MDEKETMMQRFSNRVFPHTTRSLGALSLATALGCGGGPKPPEPPAPKAAEVQAPDEGVPPPAIGEMRRVPGGQVDTIDGTVTIDAFDLGATEVSVGEYRACVEAGECKAPQNEGDGCNYGRDDRNNHPVNCVTWPEADAYCKAKGLRLPRSAELGHAARGKVGTLYPWGDDNPPDDASALCWKRDATCEVTAGPTDTGPFGHRGLAGNVREWTATQRPLDNEKGRAIRGGFFGSTDRDDLLSEDEKVANESETSPSMGFRCATDTSKAGG